MNKVFLIGNLTKNPEIKVGENGGKIARFSIAVNKTRGKDKRTDFFQITSFNGLAEICEKYLHKGEKVAVAGEIHINQYESDKGKKFFTEIIALEIEFLTRKEKFSSQNMDEMEFLPTNKEMFDIQDMEEVEDGELPF